MMLAKRAASVAAVALVVVGCSSGTKHDYGTRPSLSPTTTVAGVKGFESCCTGRTQRAQVAANLGPCPNLLPSGSLVKLNAGIRGLRNALVPINARNVRVCEYGSGRDVIPFGLVASGSLGPPAATRFGDETNRLLPRRGPGLLSGPDGVTFLLTFANDSRRVNMTVNGSLYTNGLFTAIPTPHWVKELQQYAHYGGT
jgi:hypothetical protein